MQTVRPAAVAGMFYPDKPADLSAMLHGFLANAHPQALRPKALIAPHAGYIYSGATAAQAYALLQPLRSIIKRVVLLGPVHRVWTPGLALPGVDAFQTPLGTIELDRDAIARLAGLPQVQVHPAAHAQEHSLEVHLPFLQSVLGDFKLVPLAVGGATPEQVAQVLDRLWGGEETLIVVSSDLSHFLPYQQAQQVDRATVDAMLACHTNLVGEQACGCHPINGLLFLARQRHLQPHLLHLCNSGDTAGDRNRVVGYAAIAFTEEAMFSEEKGQGLVGLARAAIARQFGREGGNPARPDWLNQAGATFVTLTIAGQLRGCIGSLVAHRPLGEDVEHNARAAAFSDPRFPPLGEAELDKVRVEVSILTPATPMSFGSEADFLAQLKPGIDGIILEYGRHRSTFLPQVWEQLPNPRLFMAHLKQKAGLPPDFWAPDMRMSRYAVEKFKEPQA